MELVEVTKVLKYLYLNETIYQSIQIKWPKESNLHVLNFGFFVRYFCLKILLSFKNERKNITKT